MEISFEQYAAQLGRDLSAEGKPSVFLLTCMDYRYAQRIIDVMNRQDLLRKYDIFVLAGAAAGANENETWRQALVEHIRAARELKHMIDQIIILEHRDCGAYKLFFKLEWDQVTPPVEEAYHNKQVNALARYLRKEFSTEIPNLIIKSWLLARDEDDELGIEEPHP
jgi:carbonic anhydrase